MNTEMNLYDSFSNEKSIYPVRDNNYMYPKILKDYYSRLNNSFTSEKHFPRQTYDKTDKKCTPVQDYKKIIDISQPIEKGMVINPPNVFEISPIRDFAAGDKMRISKICLSHTGAHIDFPSHFVPSGKTLGDYIRAYGLDVFYGPATVVEVPFESTSIDVGFLKKLGELPERILFKTRNSELYKQKGVNPNYVYITPEAAKYLAQNNVSLIGIDYIGIEHSTSTEFETHKALLSKDVLALEGIILSDVKEGIYVLSCFPIAVNAAEAGLCRAVLIEY